MSVARRDVAITRIRGMAVSPFPPGDADFDGDIDLSDLMLMHVCLEGPQGGGPLGDCRFADIDRNGSVDLGDFALFQAAFTGEKGGP